MSSLDLGDVSDILPSQFYFKVVGMYQVCLKLIQAFQILKLFLIFIPSHFTTRSARENLLCSFLGLIYVLNLVEIPPGVPFKLCFLVTTFHRCS